MSSNRKPPTELIEQSKLSKFEQALAEQREAITAVCRMTADQWVLWHGEVTKDSKVAELIKRLTQSMIEYQEALLQEFPSEMKRLLRTYIEVVDWYTLLIPDCELDLARIAGEHLGIGLGIFKHTSLAIANKSALFVFQVTKNLLAPSNPKIDLIKAVSCPPEAELKSGTLEAELFIKILKFMLAVCAHDREPLLNYPAYLLGARNSYFRNFLQTLWQEFNTAQSGEPGISLWQLRATKALESAALTLSRIWKSLTLEWFQTYPSLLKPQGINAYYECLFSVQATIDGWCQELAAGDPAEVDLDMVATCRVLNEGVQKLSTFDDLALQQELLKSFAILIPTYNRFLRVALDLKDGLSPTQLENYALLLDKIVQQLHNLNKYPSEGVLVAESEALEFMERYAELLAELPSRRPDLVRSFTAIATITYYQSHKEDQLNVFPFLAGVAALLARLGGEDPLPATQVALFLNDYSGPFEEFKQAVGEALAQVTVASVYRDFICLVLQVCRCHHNLPNFKNLSFAKLLANPKIDAALCKYISVLGQDTQSEALVALEAFKKLLPEAEAGQVEPTQLPTLNSAALHPGYVENEIVPEVRVIQTPVRLFLRPPVALTAATSSSNAYVTHTSSTFSGVSRQKLFVQAAINHLASLRPALALPDEDIQLVLAYHLWRIFACLNEYLKLGGQGSDNFTANAKYLQHLREMTDKYGYFYVEPTPSPKLSMLINLCGRCYDQYATLKASAFNPREGQWLRTWIMFLRIAKEHRNQVEHAPKDELTPELKAELKRLSLVLAEDTAAMQAILTQVPIQTWEPSSTSSSISMRKN